MDLVSERIHSVMASLEARDAADRTDGTTRELRLRAIRPEVGQMLATLIVAIGARTIVEVGTSSGYSTLYLAAGARRTGGRVVTFEVDPAKVELASGTFADAGVEDVVELRHADGVAGLASFAGRADLVFLDAEKGDYLGAPALALEARRPGGLPAADT